MIVIFWGALEDFKKEEKKDVVPSTTGEASANEWSDEFIKQAAQQFESNMAKIIGAATNQNPTNVTQNQIELNLQKMAGNFFCRKK